MATTSSEPVAVPPAGRSMEGVSDDAPAMRAWAEELVARARSEGVELTGDNGLPTSLVRRVLQTGLEVEMTGHLGYERHAAEGRGSGNSRNGSYPKTVTTDIGKVDLRVPRDRNSSFEPATVPKGPWPAVKEIWADLAGPIIEALLGLFHPRRSSGAEASIRSAKTVTRCPR